MTRVGEVALLGVGWIAGAVWWANLANTSWKVFHMCWASQRACPNS
jgi:hypothetical protein